MGKGLVSQLLVSAVENPILGLFIGMLSTALVQSSSTTTSIIVGMVAAGTVSIEGAIPMVMGANIGTTVTNMLVSIGHIGNKEEFKKAFAAATVHDFFNIMTVIVLLPFEIAFGFLSTSAKWLCSMFSGGLSVQSFKSPLKIITKPVVNFILDIIDKNAAISIILAIVFLIIALLYLTKILKFLFLQKSEGVLYNFVISKKSSGLVAMVIGAMITAVIQSSSVTTSLMVPFAVAGLATIEQIFPFCLGANVGTTVTAVLAALSTGNFAALTVAFAHFLFNILGILLIYPIKAIRVIPIKRAKWLGELTMKNRAYAVGYILIFFFALPLTILFIFKK